MQPKKPFLLFFLILLIIVIQYPSNKLFGIEHRQVSFSERTALSELNLSRSMAIIDLTILHFFDPETFEMRRYYNPFTKQKSDEKASVWMYTSGIEAVNSVLHALKANMNKSNSASLKSDFLKYTKILEKLYSNLDYYLGTFELTSYTQTKMWSVYAVDRVGEKGKANVTGVLNVYDDQMWLVRELLDSYKITGKKDYLEKAEYLTSYILDGWDTTLDGNGNENGGIPWGPGYTTKHACSNSPMITPLVWLSEIYKGKRDVIEHRFIDKQDLKSRRSKLVNKEKYYLGFAKSIYEWQKRNLLNQEGIYSDMLGGCSPDCNVKYDFINGMKYRSNTKLTKAVGESFSYNTGTMISGAVELYLVSKEKRYFDDADQLGKNSFSYFGTLNKEVPNYVSFETNGFKNWFNGILMRSYRDLIKLDKNASNYLQAYQKNLDYGYNHYNYEGFLPTNLLKGWSSDKKDNYVEGMFMFTYASEYAILSEYYTIQK